MKRIALALFVTPLLLAAPLAAGVGGGMPPVHGALAHLLSPPGRATVASTNWSGYAVYKTGTKFTDVKGKWVQPAASCGNPLSSDYASFWVGIDGYKSSTVEQIGTDSDCSGTTPQYYAWYEMFPAAPVNLSSSQVAVRPGDHIEAEVSFANGRFTLRISNTTTGQAFSVQQAASAARTSAEWVAEAPSQCIVVCSVLPLANFGSVRFQASYATGKSHVGTISDKAWLHDLIVMKTSNGTVKAQPSGLSPGGKAFTVTWQHS